MYLSHYNLVEKPFQISTDPKFLWLGEKHREALAVLKYSIINNQGFVLLTGDVGTGKTTLINALLDGLDKVTIVAVVSDPKLERLEFFNLIAKAFKFKKTFEDKLDFTSYFGQFLKAAYKENRKVLLIIDEAQNISLELLEEIRLMSNIEIPERKLLNIFFVGQIEFNNILMRNECRPLRQRITLTYNIEPLTENETREYITHRLKVVGSTNEIFTRGAVGKVYSFSKGYPRLINIVCDRALLTGYVKDLTTVTPKIIKECTKELSLPGELKNGKIREPRQRTKKENKLRKRAMLYSCLLFLLIPLVYPPVSIPLKGYLTDVINFYDQVFQQSAGPAHSYNAQKARTQENERRSQTNTPSLNQSNSTDSKPSSDDTAKIDKSTGDEASDPDKHDLNLEDCMLTIPFNYNSNEVPESAYAAMENCASIMLQNQTLAMIIRGYTDDAGSDIYNKKLSAFRANIVKSYFVGRGVDPSRIKGIAMGEENQLKPNNTYEGRKANRRVEVELVAEGS